MDAKTAEWVLVAITAVAAIVWLVGVQFLIRSFPGVIASHEDDERLDVQEPPPSNWICSVVAVEGQAGNLIAKAVSALASGNAPGIGLVKILERGDDRLVVEGVRGDPSGRQSLGGVRHAEFRFTSLGRDRTEIRCVAQVADQQWLLWVGALFQVLGLAALIAGFLLVKTLVVTSPNPAVRWQTVQMLQVCHFLWPVFLFGGLYRFGRRTVQAGLDLLVHNLPYREA
jgi:hypothetical protein